MIFTETALKGAYIIDLEPIEDDRGFFARTFCRKEFEDQGLIFEASQCNVAYNHRKGTLRGMHYQGAPHQEIKIIRCFRGAIYDVIVDLRSDSATFMKWIGVELSAKNRRMLYAPRDFAHGYQTLEDDTEIFYLVSESYHPESERGVRWDDPAFGIEWPAPHEKIISAKDRGLPDFLA
jgi:dTDP-4-dehydrorhamnose 3,5-epimerase